MEIGTRLGPYEIIGALGAGGMGEVYRARDNKLGRDVAIKVLPEEFTENPQKLARFEREARFLAALNHPGIATLHGLEESEGKPFLVMELVEGETLSERISRGPIPVQEAMTLSLQIAEALEAAHEKGVIHRDLKPANIKVDPAGHVKVLDFGLAKAFAEEVPESELSASPTLSRDATKAGVILGTAVYMSPEQARGKTVDKRTDIFSFGAVLFEMLTGKRAFRGEDVSDVLAAVIRSEPDWKALPTDIPPSVKRLLRRCLTKDRKERLQAIGEARIAATEYLAEPDTALPSETASVRIPLLSRTLAAIAGLFAVALLATLWLSWQTVSAPQSPVRLSAQLASGEHQLPAYIPVHGSMVVLSPDGKTLVFVERGPDGLNSQLYIRSLDSLEATALSGTEGAASPFFSPDGQWLAFFAGGALKKVSVSGGAALTIAEVNSSRGGTWGPDDTIVYTPSPGAGLYRVPASGGTPVELTKLSEGEFSHSWPSFLPNGKAVLFVVGTLGEPFNNGTIEAVLLETGERRVLYRGGTYPRYASSGHLLYARQVTLFAMPFDADRIESTGEPSPVIEGVQTYGTAGLNGASYYAFSEEGSLVYLPGVDQGNTQFVWVDRAGREEPMGAEPQNYGEFALSPDATQVAVRVIAENTDLWIYDLLRHTSTRLTFDPGAERFPLWTPDGQRVAFGGAKGMFWTAADGTGDVEPLAAPSNEQDPLRAAAGQEGLRPEAFSLNGTVLVFQDLSKDRDLGMMSLEGERASTLLLDTEFEERNAELSPDGRYMAYESDESGQFEVYVRPFPDVDAGKWPVSSEGGRWPFWSRDGRELFYLAQDLDLIGVSIETEPTFTLGTREPLFNMQPYAGITNLSRRISISPDGERFLMLKASATAPEGIVVVLNWFDELKHLAPTN